jgi:hypothetical protein
LQFSNYPNCIPVQQAMFNSLVVLMMEKTRHIFLLLDLPILIRNSINQPSLISLHSFLGDVDLCYLVELSLKSPCLHPLFRPAFTHKPFFHWYPQSKEVLLNLNVCSSNGGAWESQHETQFTTKSSGKTSLGPNYFVL